MKANQKFMKADDAVSPVIGVILMVAITVVLAAVVFVLVSDLGGGSGTSQPAISWSVSQAEGSASVTSADPGANWDEFEIRLSDAGEVGVNYNSQGAAAAPGATQGIVHDGSTDYEQLPTNGIGGGDKLFFCLDGVASGPLTATLRHIDSNSVAREFVFSNAPACAVAGP